MNIKRDRQMHRYIDREGEKADRQIKREIKGEETIKHRKREKDK